MSRLITFPSIEQYRSVVHNVKAKTSYVGKDANGNAIHDYTKPCPTLRFEGTVKLHGTNSCVVKCGEEIWAQSKERVLTPEDDNYGFAMFTHTNRDHFKNMMFDRWFPSDKTVAIFGEYCGSGIQKGMAISKLPKMFVVFSIATVEENIKTWLTRDEVVRVVANTDNIKCIYDFPHWYIDIDFNNPHEVQNKLAEMTLQVEAECPAGKVLGANGIGEGIVWKCITPGYEDSGFWFKVKGDKHSETRVKVLAPVDVERINNIKELSERLTPTWRLEQAFTKTFNGVEPSMSSMGSFIKNTMEDIIKEEIDTLAASGFSTKEITSPVAARCREFLSQEMNKF